MTIRHIVFIPLLAFAFIASPLTGQTGTTESLWKTLAKITYKKEYDDFLCFKIDKPVFSEEIKALNGKVVRVKGFIIPVKGYKRQKEFILYAFPYKMFLFLFSDVPE